MVNTHWLSLDGSATKAGLRLACLHQMFPHAWLRYMESYPISDHHFQKKQRSTSV